MTAFAQLEPGANAALGGTQVTAEIEVPQLGGVAVLVEQRSGELHVAGAGDPFVTTEGPEPGGRTVVVNADLAAVPGDVERLRVLVWSPGPELPLARATARVSVDGAPAVAVELAPAERELRAAELLELYRRGAEWKVRAVASGWLGHVAAMADALRLPESAFPVRTAPSPEPLPGARTARPASTATPSGALATPPALTDPPHEGPSPAVGPPPLRALLDDVVGPGPRFGDDTFVDFSLHGVLLRLSYVRSGEYAQIVAVSPAGEGDVTDTVALAALRVTGEAPLARVSFDPDGAAFVSAPAVAAVATLDTALLKALLAEVWVTAHRFTVAMRTVRRWQRPEHLTEQVPRELRLGIAEELQDEDAWTELRERLLAADCMPLVDAPAAILVPTNIGQLAVGPSMLAATTRAWSIVVERTVRADVRPRPGLWRALAERNTDHSFVRVGVQPEGLPGDPPAITISYAALQLPRTQVMEDLQRGLEFVDDAAELTEPLLRDLAADSSDYRNNLPWPPSRRWNGPGSELTQHLLVREVAELPGGAAVPPQLVKRARAQASGLGRPGLGYLAHVALTRAEAQDGASSEWLAVAREFVALAPVEHAPGDAPCATASLHVRLNRLDAPRPMRPPPPPTERRRRGPARRLFG